MKLNEEDGVVRDEELKRIKRATNEEWQRLAKMEESLRMAVAEVKKQATDENLQRVADMEESFRRLM